MSKKQAKKAAKAQRDRAKLLPDSTQYFRIQGKFSEFQCDSYSSEGVVEDVDFDCCVLIVNRNPLTIEFEVPVLNGTKKITLTEKIKAQDWTTRQIYQQIGEKVAQMYAQANFDIFLRWDYGNYGRYDNLVFELVE